MAVLWGHLLDDTELFSFRGFGFKAIDMKNYILSMMYFVKVSCGA